MPDAGGLYDARAYLGRFGLYGSNGMGMCDVSAAELRANLEVTGGMISPYEADAALQASTAYVSEHHRSNGNSTDAPYDWQKTARDIEIFAEQAERDVKAIMGE